MRDSIEAAQLQTIEEVYRLAASLNSNCVRDKQFATPAPSKSANQVTQQSGGGKNNKKKAQGSGCNAITPAANPTAKPAPTTAATNPAAPEAKKQYTGSHPKCATCNYHHPAISACRLCTNCNRYGHTNPYCRQANPAQQAQQASAQAALPAPPAPLQNPKPVNAVRACYKCGDTTHLHNQCPQLNQDQQPAARGERSTSMQIRLEMTMTLSMLPESFSVEVANGKSILVNSIVRDCSLILNDHVFSVDLICMRLGSFDFIIGMDWLRKNHAEIVCHEKLVRLPLPSGDTLIVYGDRPSKRLRLMSCTQASRSLRKQNPAFLVHVVEQKGKGKKISDVPVVCDFTDVFPEDLPGLPPPRSVDFRIDLVPGATPVARAPYHLAPSEMQELSSQLQELIDKGFIRLSA
ncbi:uncharacterized protein LOC118479561 [Helianthus annuus]|uniref:uncharacterized protein LOC118479561 n=1 Tax=Helianthus annuus TaxID=4232 RepID=UPI0016532960|nr:uncharacterized protein LOC118479561 [Helianthus annuus]